MSCSSWLNKCKQQWRAHQTKQRATLFDLTVLLRQLATLLNAGVPLLKTCTLLEMSQPNMALKQLMCSIKQDVLAGKSLSLSLQRHPHYFDALTCHLIKIGEHTGYLDTALNAIADQKEKLLAFKKRIQQALLYPLILMITAILVIVCMLLFIIPRFADFFQNAPVQLPALTRWIFALAANMPWVCLSLILLPTLAWLLNAYHPRAKRGRRWLAQRIKQLPGLRTHLAKIMLARFARHLALACSAGIPMHAGLTLIAPGLSNPEPIQYLYHKICAGWSLNQAMQTHPYFPTLMVQMVKTGEEAGMLVEMLNKIADFYEADIDRLLKYGDQLLEPLIILMLGALIGGLVIGMYLPIFNLGTAF